MTAVDDINRVFRDHERFSGDGKPNAPANAPLPVGDPRSGVNTLILGEIRRVMISILQAQGDPQALQAILADLGKKADLASAGKSFSSRQQAVDLGQAALPVALSQIMTREGNFIVMRGPYAETDDPLFSTVPRWGVVSRLPNDVLLEGKQPTGDYATREEVRELTAFELDTLDLIIGSMDGSRRRLWLEASREDGGPSDHSVRMIRLALERNGATLTRVVSAPGVLYAVTDQSDRHSFVAVRDLDGGPTEFAVKLLRAGLAEGGQRMTDMTRLAVWGSSTVEFMAPQLRAMAAGLGMTYHDGGDAGVLTRTIMAQMGVEPAKISFPDNTVPASGTVEVRVSNVGFNTSTKPWRGVVRGTGIEGTLSSGLSFWTFQRHGAGPAVAVEADTDFLPIAGMTEQYSLPLINIGKNDLTSGVAAATVIERTQRIIDWLPTGNRRFLVMGHFVDTYTAAGDAVRARIQAVNAALAAAYGDQFIDLDRYVIGSQIWTDTGIAPTQADLDQQAIGNKPPSLSMDNLHLNAVANQATVTNLIRPRPVALGWI